MIETIFRLQLQGVSSNLFFIRMNAELYKPFKLIFLIFKTTGMWQDGEQSWLYFIVGYLLHFFLIELCIVGEFIYAYNAKNLEDFIETMGLTMTYISEMFKCLNFFYKLRSIKKSVETLNLLLKFSSDERWESRGKIKSQVALVFKVIKAFWFSAYVTCISASLVPFLSHKLPYKVWFPFETINSETGFWIASIYLIFSSFVVSVVDISLDTLPVIFMTFAIGLINELSDRLVEIGNTEPTNSKNKSNNQDLDTKELVKCIKIHQKIKEFVEEIHGNFSTVILVQGLFSALMLCTGAFTMSTVSSLKVMK